MQAVILAGGKGTRLQELTAEVPKPMIRVGEWPIIEHQIRLLQRYGIQDILILVNHLRQPLMAYVGDGAQWGVNVSYFEEKEPLGTAGAFALIGDLLQETFLVLYGDVMLDMDFSRLIQYHNRQAADATLVVHPNDHPYDSDLLEVDGDQRIVAFHSKPHDPTIYYKNLVNAGVYLFQKKVLDFLPGPVKCDFGKDIFPCWVERLKLVGYNTSEYLKDMGTPDRLQKVSQDLASGKIARRNLSQPQSAIFLDRDGVINEERHLVCRTEDLILYPYSGAAIKKINQSEYLSVVVTNQSVVARNLCSIEELETIHKKLDTDLGQGGARLDALYYCPYHPDKGYPGENPLYKKEHPWRKPSPGMLLQAAEDFNIDLSRSYIIGDRETDVLAGKSVGATTIAVRSGYGYQGAHTVPDYWFADLQEAVQFILDDPLKAICEQVVHEVEQAERLPLVILIGGNAQSGKSTFTSRLVKAFRKSRITSSVVHLDDFLLPKEQRRSMPNVFRRFDLEATALKIKALLRHEEVLVKPYEKDEKLEREEKVYRFGAEKVLIVEGVPALALKLPDEGRTMQIHVASPFDRYQKRFYDLYQWKGYDEKAIDELFAARVKDEYELIEPMQQEADITITL